jgi:nucleoside-diphosphate-sugar epimerase
MKKIALLGASSQIAKDLIRSMAKQGRHALLLYVRDTARAVHWLASSGLTGQCTLHLYAQYGNHPHDAVINFVGVGDPQRAAQMGASIFGVTQEFDDMVMRGLSRNPQRRYIFLSSGAAYGSTFLAPADIDTRASIAINALLPQEYYAVAKLHAEAKHRAHAELAITDIRVFNYFSRTQDLSARFFITDVLHAIRDDVTLQTSSDYMVRDFLHPSDFHHLVECILNAPAGNQVLDCYSRAPIDKPMLLQVMQDKFGLRYEMSDGAPGMVNATGSKPCYYSLNHRAAEIGYQPQYSSQEGIVLESMSIFDQTALP